jgi:hypothetical protein
VIWNAVASLALIIGSGPNPYADIACDDARQQSIRAYDHLATALNYYIKCLNNRRQGETCSHEFTQLELAQSSFARAANAVELWCTPS